MDVYKEQIVKKTPSSNDQIRKFSLVLGAVSIAGLLFLVVSTFVPQYILVYLLLVGLMIYGVVYLIHNMSTEYEYILTNGEIDIDKIMGQRKRKRLFSFRLQAVTAFGEYDPSVISPDTTVFFAADGTGENDYCAQLIDKEHGATCVVFTPNVEMLALMKPFLPRNLRK